MGLTTDYKERKNTPIVRGCLDYFPDALAAVSRLSLVANDKHNPGEPLHWSKGKSNDHADCLVRHLVERGTPDPDMRGLSHTVQVAWRALALLQTEIEERREKGLPALEYPQKLPVLADSSKADPVSLRDPHQLIGARQG